MAINYNNNNQGIGTLDLSQYGLIQPDNNINNQQANWINTLSGGMFGTTDEQDAQNAALEQIQEIRKNQFEGYPSGTNAEWVEEYKGNYPDLYKEYQNKQNQIQKIKDQYKGVEAIDQASLVNEYGYPLMASLSGAIPNKVSAIDQMANYDWSNFDTNIAKNMALANKMNTTLDNTLTEEIDINSLRDPFAPLENQFMGPHDPSVFGMNMPNTTFAEAMVDEDRIPGRIQKSVPNYQSGWDKFTGKIGDMWSGAKDTLSNFKMPPIGIMGLLSHLGKPDTPYQKFQKETFKDMGWQGESNKDPWGKNINSLFGDYDVTEQWGDLMGSKLGQKYGYADAFADGVLDDAELAKMQELGLKGWQLNRAIGLSTAAKKAQDWKDKRAAEKIITNKMKNIDTSGGKTPTYTPTGNYGKKQGTTGSWTPGGSYQGAKSSPKGYSARSHSGGNYGGQHHWARGGRVGYANGGLASLFTRRG